MSISALSSNIASTFTSSGSSRSARAHGPSADEIFTKTDSNGDGSIDKTEFAAALSKAPGGSSLDTDKLFSTLDSDGDGKVTQSENSSNFDALRQQLDAQFDSQRMSGAMEGMQSGGMPPPPDANALFDKTDSNSDGSIDLSELNTALSNAPQNGNAPDAASLFSQLDADGNGKVTKQEHSDGLAAMHPQQGAASSSGSSVSSTESSSSSDTSTSNSSAEESLRAMIAALLEQYKKNSGDDSSSLYGTLLSAVG